MGLANLLVAFVFITIVSARPTEKDLTIFQAMMSDAEICNSVRNFLNSTNYSGNNCNFPVISAQNRSMDELICFGIYDMAFKLCHVANRNNVDLEFSKQTHELMVKEMKDVQVNKDIDTGDYCKEIVEKINNPYNKTIQFVNDLKKKFVNRCKHACSSEVDNYIANPLCVILHMMVVLDINKPNPLSGEQVDVTNVNAPAQKGPEKRPENVPVEDKEPTETVKVDVKQKPKKDELKKQMTVDPVNVPDQANVESEKKTGPKKVDGGNVAQVSQAVTKPKKTEALPKVTAEKQKVLQVTTEVTKKVADDTGAGAESENVGQGSYKGSSKKTEEKAKIDQQKVEKEMVEEDIPKFEDINDKKSDETRLSLDKPELGDDEYGDADDDDTHTKDENEKIDQNHLAHVYQGNEGDEDGSHAFLYFTMLSLGCIILYVMYLSKQKILATIVRLRRSRNRGRRRPSTANYRKLDCTLEEAVTSQCNANVTHVIY